MSRRTGCGAEGRCGRAVLTTEKVASSAREAREGGGGHARHETTDGSTSTRCGDIDAPMPERAPRQEERPYRSACRDAKESRSRRPRRRSGGRDDPVGRSVEIQCHSRCRPAMEAEVESPSSYAGPMAMPSTCRTFTPSAVARPAAEEGLATHRTARVPAAEALKNARPRSATQPVLRDAHARQTAPPTRSQRSSAQRPARARHKGPPPGRPRHGDT